MLILVHVKCCYPGRAVIKASFCDIIVKKRKPLQYFKASKNFNGETANYGWKIYDTQIMAVKSVIFLFYF